MPDPQELVQRISQLENELRAIRQARRTRSRWALVALLAAVATGTAFAANGNCPNGLPFCFAANQPALAREVNHNFAQLKEWLEAKVGTVGANVVMSGTPVMSGYQSSCFHGSGALIAPVCCRINVRNGSTVCLIAADGNASGFVTGPASPFAATTDGSYSLTCYSGVSGDNFPTCCRTDNAGAVTSCRAATNWSLTGWNTPGTF